MGQQVILDGSASQDPDADPLRYTWSVDGPAPFTLDDATSVSPRFIAGTTGTYTFSLVVSDGAATAQATMTLSNGILESTDEVVIYVVDATPPVIALNGANPLLLELSSTYPEPGATASDLVDGDLTSSIQTSGSVDIDTEDSYTITYEVHDAAGNAAESYSDVVDGRGEKKSVSCV